MNAVHRLHPARSLNARIAMKSRFHGQITVGYWMGCARLRTTPFGRKILGFSPIISTYKVGDIGPRGFNAHAPRECGPFACCA